MILYNITGSPYWFLVKDKGIISLSELEAWNLAANGMQSAQVTVQQLDALNAQIRALANRALYV